MAVHFAAPQNAALGDTRTFIHTGQLPDPKLRAERAFTYPQLRLSYLPTVAPPKLARAYARFSQPGVYGTTITRPELFGDYLTEQLALILGDFEAEVTVRRSDQEIPFPYVLDGADAAAADVKRGPIARHFPTTELAHDRRRGDRQLLGARRPARCGRWRCSTPCAPTSRWRGLPTIPARRPSTCSLTCSSPTTTVTSTSSCGSPAPNSSAKNSPYDSLLMRRRPW